jgi:methylmalonyl-CoA/ethylmalonyl-CoA epimerase
LGTLKKITEIGVAVRDLEKVTDALVRCFGGEAGEVFEMPQFGMRFRMVRIADVDFELMEPTDENGMIARFICTHGEGLHHVAFAVDRAADRMADLKEKGCRMINDTPLDLLGGKVGFLHPGSFGGIMFELIEYPGEYIPPGSGPLGPFLGKKGG